MFTGVLARHSYGGNAELGADGLGDRSRGNARLRDRVDRGTGWSAFKGEAHEARGIEPMDGRPTVGAVIDVARGALRARAIAIFKTSFERWVTSFEPSDLGQLVRDSLDQLRVIAAAT